jgi:hypothetical protein
MRCLRYLAVLTAALAPSRGLVAQDGPLPGASVVPLTQAQLRARLLPPTLVLATVDSMLFPPPEPIRALYVNAWAFASPRLWSLIALAESTEVNALVVDVKDDTGCLLYPSRVRTAREIGANACARLKNVKARLDSLWIRDILPIARVVVAKDPLLAEGKPRWAVRERDGGALWRDRIGMAWVDAYNDSVWIYAAQLAEEAARLGFAEIQFDYVRFPDEPRSRLATAVFAARRAGDTPRAAVRRNVRMLKERLRPHRIPVTFDVFGLTTSYTGDMGVGQVWEDFADVADVLLPMVYPSHYYPGAYGYRRPNHQPYEIVRNALRDAQARTAAAGPAIRPYLQAFTLGRRQPRYTAHEIREQIRAAEDLGIRSWVLWNPRSVYQRAALRPVRELAPPAPPTEASPE